MKQPCKARSRVLWSAVLLRRTPVTPLASPSTSSNTLCVCSTILPLLTLSISLSIMMASALNLSRRCTKCTWLAMLDRYKASSTAVLPPPTTHTACSR